MKRINYLLLFLALLLSGCSGQADPSASAKEKDAIEVPAYYDGYPKNPQVADDRALQQEGQKIRDSKGEMELKAVNLESQAYNIGSIELTIREAKIAGFKPDYSLIDFYHSYTHEPEFDMVKLFVEIKNTSDEPLQFGPAAILKTSAGETKLWEDDVFLEELNGEIAAGETKKGNLGFIIENPDFDSLTLTTSDVFGMDNEKVKEAKEIELNF